MRSLIQRPFAQEHKALVQHVTDVNLTDNPDLRKIGDINSTPIMWHNRRTVGGSLLPHLVPVKKSDI